MPLAQQDIVLRGHSIECRVNAEDPRNGFTPNPGRIFEWVPPQGAGIRIDTYVEPGTTIPPNYDSMVAKVIVHADDRPAALALMARALAKLRIGGVRTTVALHQAILADPEFAARPVTTRWLEESFLPTWTEPSP